jgi:hypothetical protein
MLKEVKDTGCWRRCVYARWSTDSRQVLLLTASIGVAVMVRYRIDNGRALLVGVREG